MRSSSLFGEDAVVTSRADTRRMVDQCVPTFDDFWKAWPRREAKKAALRAWEKLSAASRIAAVAALPAHMAQWRRAGTARCHIPHPATWLNGERWDDDFEPVPGIAAVPRIAGAGTPVEPTPKPWPCAWSTIVAKGNELGVMELPGEQPQQFKARVFAAAGLTEADRRQIFADYGVRV